MSALRSVVLQHFRHPKNRGALEHADASADGANPLCGDRVRVQLRADGGVVVDARFTADACALCVASASVLTEHVRGMHVDGVTSVNEAWLFATLDGEPPPARRKCALLPLETLRRAAEALSRGAQ